jgi:hypothetical protein
MEVQATRLVNVSGLQDSKLKKSAVDYIVKNKLIVRPISKLIALLSHPCSEEQIQNINKEFERKYKYLVDSDSLDDVGPDLKPNGVSLIQSMGKTAGLIIGEGFDIAFKDNLNINSVTGAITVKRDAEGNPDTRFTKCAAAEVSLETPEPAAPKVAPVTIYKNPADFREFLQKQSDPFKGSQQGVGRTRKHKKRSKKTLRRRKVRRNMH